MSRKTVSIPAVILIACQNLIAGQSLTDKVRKYGDVDQLVMREFSPVDVATLVKSAPVIARGVVMGEASSFIADDKIWTTYQIQLLSVRKGRSDLEGQVVTVRRPGGQVTIEGHTVKAWEPDFPSFRGGQEYVLFLQSGADGNFQVVYGAQGAFAVEAAHVRQVSTKFGTWNKERGSVGLAEFLSEVAAAERKK